MPTPMQPTKPMTPASAMAAKAASNLAAAGGAKPAQGQLSALDKLKAIGQGEDPNTATGTSKGPGEKSFSIKTAQDPDGTIHVYAKNEQEAKQKYQQLGNPMGMASHAEEVQEAKVKQRLDPKCWDGYKKQGTKIKGGVRVNNCVKEEELSEAGFRTPSDWLAKQMDKISAKGAAEIGWKHNYDEKFWDSDREEKDPFGNYRKSWTQKNKSGDHSGDAPRQEPKFTRSATLKPYHIITVNDRRGDTVIMAKSPADAKAQWERKFGGTGDKILRVSKPREMEESMTTLKTTFEGMEDSIASLLENFGLENGRDFYIDGTIHTLDEQVAQDILSVLADHELPGQARVRQLEEGWAISLIGQGEELVENLTVGDSAIEIRHIGEGVVRVYVNNELAEQFDTGTAAFKYVKALQENLAEADNELMSALSAEAGEDLMKIGNITEGWEDMLKAVKDRDDKKVGDKWKTSKGEVEKTATGVKHTRSYDAKTGETDDAKPKDADGNPVKRGRGRPKKVRESLAAIQAMRKQVAEALAKIDSLPEAKRNTPQVQAMVDRLTESVRTAIARAK